MNIVGEAKTPDALRNASDQFFEWLPAETLPEPCNASKVPPATPKPPPKRRPKTVINAVNLLAVGTPDGRVGLGALGQYLKRTDPAFSPKLFGHSALSDMVRTYPDLVLTQEGSSGFWVSLKNKTETAGA